MNIVIFLVLAGLALVFRWLTERAQKQSEDNLPSPDKPLTRAPAESEEQKIRRFLEALGRPAGSTPPQKIPSRTFTPRPLARKEKPQKQKARRRSWAQPLPPLTSTPADWSEFPSAVNPPAAASAALPPPLPGAAASTKRQTKKADAIKRTTAALPPSSLGALLRDRTRVREAILLREILGPPRALQASEF